MQPFGFFMGHETKWGRPKSHKRVGKNSIKYVFMKKISFIVLIVAGLLAMGSSCSKNDSSNPVINPQTISFKNGEEIILKINLDGKNTPVRIKLDSIIDERPLREDCMTIYTTLKYVRAFYEVQINNQMTDTLSLRRVMCATEGDLDEKDYGFDNKLIKGVSISLVNITEKHSPKVKINDYTTKLLIKTK